MQPFEREVRQFVVDNFLFGEGGEDLGVEDSLLEKGLIDSTGILELVDFVQKSFGVKVEDHEIVPANLDSIHKVAAFVRQKLGDTGERGNKGKSSHIPGDREMAG